MNVMPAWSFSSLNQFQNCPRSYELTRVTKEVKQVESAAMRHGTIQHEHLEYRVSKNKPLPPELEWVESSFKMLEDSGAELIAEQSVGLTKGLSVTGFFAKDVWVRGKLDLLARFPEKSVVCDWKGLALDTKIPTPTGWTTMGDIVTGDMIFGGDGSPCRVTAKSEVHHRDCYELVFDDTTRIVCDDEHLWVTNGEVRSTKIIAATLLKYGQSHHRIELHGGLSLPDVDLPIHPYVLGVWLGDGKHTSGEVCKPDQELWDNVATCGYDLSHDYSARAGKGLATTKTIKGLRTQLRKAGLLGNKHIPDIYLRASHNQRLQLLRGLMDTDGSGNHTRKQAVFTTCDKRLSDAVMELLLTLGQRPSQATVLAHGFGLEVMSYPVHFKPTWGLIPFSLSRKQAKISGAGPGKSWRRLIISANKIVTVPTQCISVDSSDNTYLCSEKMVVTHNTGKRKFDSDQLMLFAAFEFAARQDIDEVRTGYVWLKDKKIDSETFRRSDLGRIWGHFLPKVERLEQAYLNDDWPCRPSGLCGWCSATPVQCKHKRN